MHDHESSLKQCLVSGANIAAYRLLQPITKHSLVLPPLHKEEESGDTLIATGFCGLLATLGKTECQISLPEIVIALQTFYYTLCKRKFTRLNMVVMATINGYPADKDSFYAYLGLQT